MGSHDAGPDTMAARTKLADLVAEATGGLSDRDHAVLELSYRHGLEGVDLATALEVSVSQARAMATRMTRMIERSLGALLLARRVRRTPALCDELAAILTGWDGDFTALLRGRVIRHIDSCPGCEAERRRLVTPSALLGVPPVFVSAPEPLRAQTLGRIRLVPAVSGGVAAVTERPVVHHRTSRRLSALLALFALLLLTLFTGGSLNPEPAGRQTPPAGPAASSADPAGASASPALRTAAAAAADPAPAPVAIPPVPPPARGTGRDIALSAPPQEPVRPVAPSVRPPRPTLSERRPSVRVPVASVPRPAAVTGIPPHRPTPVGRSGRPRHAPTSPPTQTPPTSDTVS